MVEVGVDPSLDKVTHVAKVHDHAESIQRIGLNIHFEERVVSVQVPTLAVVVQQTVTIAELDSLRKGALAHKDF